MVGINGIHINKKIIPLIILLSCAISQSSANETLASSIDCSDVDIKYSDNPEWTHRERIEAMDRAFFQSVNHFELCNLSNPSKSSSSSASASTTNQASNTNTGNEGNVDSVASAEMTGTEAESTLPSSNSSESSNISENTTNTSAKKKGGGSNKNGVTPKDIPSADNDDAIAAQIRLAAEIEKDPVKKQKLWNEYRKYKGQSAK